MAKGTNDSSPLGGIMTGAYTGGKKTGWSLRQSLYSQGVTSEESMRNHIAFVANTLQVNPDFDITQYRVDPNYPNGNPVMG